MVGHGLHNSSEPASTILGMEPNAAGPGPWFIEAAHPLYPARFAELPVPPARLWVEGRLPAAEERMVAVVGSRAASRAGAARVHELAAGLSGAGWSIISGGALGIDAAA